jgi:hypothetical protein
MSHEAIDPFLTTEQQNAVSHSCVNFGYIASKHQVVANIIARGQAESMGNPVYKYPALSYRTPFEPEPFHADSVRVYTKNGQAMIAGVLSMTVDVQVQDAQLNRSQFQLFAGVTLFDLVPVAQTSAEPLHLTGAWTIDFGSKSWKIDVFWSYARRPFGPSLRGVVGLTPYVQMMGIPMVVHGVRPPTSEAPVLLRPEREFDVLCYNDEHPDGFFRAKIGPTHGRCMAFGFASRLNHNWDVAVLLASDGLPTNPLKKVGIAFFGSAYAYAPRASPVRPIKEMIHPWKSDTIGKIVGFTMYSIAEIINRERLLIKEYIRDAGLDPPLALPPVAVDANRAHAPLRAFTSSFEFRGLEGDRILQAVALTNVSLLLNGVFGFRPIAIIFPKGSSFLFAGMRQDHNMPVLYLRLRDFADNQFLVYHRQNSTRH